MQSFFPDNVDIRHLRYFAAVARFRGVTDAAIQLNTTRTSIGQQMRTLEERLGMNLFTRSSGNRMRLTATGKLFHSHTLRILDEWDSFLSGLSELHEPPSPSLFRLAVPEYLSQLGFISMLEERLPPSVKVQIVEQCSDYDPSMFLEGEADGALSVGVPQIKGVKGHAIWQGRPVLLLPVGHELLKGREAEEDLALSDLEPLHLIELDPARYPIFCEFERRLFAEEKVSPPRRRRKVGRVSSAMEKIELEGLAAIALEGTWPRRADIGERAIRCSEPHTVYLLTPSTVTHPLVSAITKTPRPQVQIVNLELKPVVMFLQLAKCKSVTRLARFRNVTQPAITQTIQNLQSSLQCELIDRTSGTLELTPQGRILLRKASRFVDLLEQRFQEIKADNRLGDGKVVVGVDTDSFLGFVWRAAKRLRRESGDFRLLFEDTFEEDSLSKLENREIDLLITPSSSIRESLGERRCLLAVWECPTAGLKAIVPRTCPLADQTSLTLPELGEQRIVMFHREYLRGLDQLLEEADLLGNIRMLAASTESLLADVEAGNGVGLFTGYLEIPKGIPAAIVSVEGCDPIPEELNMIHLVWREDLDRGVIQLAREALLEEIKILGHSLAWPRAS